MFSLEVDLEVGCIILTRLSSHTGYIKIASADSSAFGCDCSAFPRRERALLGDVCIKLWGGG